MRFGGLLVILGSACSYAPPSSSAGPVDDTDVDAPAGTDAAPEPRDIPHLPMSAEVVGTGDLILADGTRIDTGQLAIVGSNVPAGVEIVAVPQEPSGLELAVIRAGTVTMPVGARVRAFGTRPLVILATTITIDGTLDGGGQSSVPGPGSSPFAVAVQPVGGGGNGVHTSSFNDGGGGGGGHRSPGASGGRGSINCSPLAAAGAGGIETGTAAIERLIGGSAGGQGAAVACPKGAPGAGGGAIQLSATSSIELGAMAAINVGGGGGRGGDNCGGSDTGAGSGGGAGGTLFLDAPAIVWRGVVGANGGGGGGGASSPGVDGMNGGDAVASADPASGGDGGGSFGARGGDGATATSGAGPGLDNGCDGNGGGGGGGVGAIVFHVDPASFTMEGVASPMPLIVELAR